MFLFSRSRVSATAVSSDSSKHLSRPHTHTHTKLYGTTWRHTRILNVQGGVAVVLLWRRVTPPQSY